MREIKEYCQGEAGKPIRVDAAKGILFSVPILGERSANGNVYPRSAREHAAGRMEGARSYADHAARGAEGSTRSVFDIAGIHRNVRESNGKLVSDFHFPPDTELGKTLLWGAVHAPESIGFSIATRVGREREAADGTRVVEEIAWDGNRDSIDLVSRPATTRGLAEHLQGRDTVKRKRIKILEYFRGLADRCTRDQRAVIREAAEAGILSPDDAMTEPDADDTPDHEAALQQGFVGAISAVVTDKSLDLKGKLAKIKDILAAQAKLVSGKSGGGKGPGQDDDDAMESRRGGGRPLLIDRGSRDGNHYIREERTSVPKFANNAERIAFLRGQGRR